MTPARNNVRATRHFGIPARKSSPSAPLQPFPREKNSPGTPLQQFPREKVRPATASPWPNREKTLPARPKTPKSSHFSRAGRTFSRFQRRTTEQGEFSPATTPLNTHHRDTTTPTGTKPTQQRRRQRAQPGHESARGTKLSQHSHLKAQPVQNSPHNTRHKARPVQNSPGTPKNNENWPFLASRENSFPFPTPHHRAGRIFSRNNTILVSISTQLTGWSPLSPRHQTNAPLSSALCGLLAAHHDAAPERAGTGRRLADWKWPRHPQASSLHPTTRTNVSDVRPPSSTG